MAAAIAEQAANSVSYQRQTYSSAFFLYHAARSYAMAGRWDQALNRATRSRELALSASDSRIVAAASYIVAASYYVLNEFELAEREAEMMLRHADSSSRDLSFHRLMSAILAKRGKRAEAMRYSRDAVHLAFLHGGPEEVAHSLNEHGLRLLESGDSESSSVALTEAFRLRNLNQSPLLDQSYHNLGRLMLLQSKPADAVMFFQRSLERPASDVSLRVWTHYRLGQAWRDLGESAKAMQSFREAASLSRRLRLYLPLGGDFQLRTGERLHDLQDALIETAAPSFLAKDAGLLEEVFSRWQESRVWSLLSRSELRGAWNRQPGDGYFAALARIRRLEGAVARGDSKASIEIDRVRDELSAAEAKAGLGVGMSDAGPQQRLSCLRNKLRPDEFLFAFHLGADRSFRFQLYDGRLSVSALPPRGTIVEAVNRFRALMMDQRKEAASVGADLFRTLFGTSLDHAAPTLLTIVPDGALFGLPFAALVTEMTEDGPRFLVQKHAIRLAPSAFYFGRQVERRSEMTFAGIADPIFNRADERWSGRRAVLPLFSALGGSEPTELPRLVATGGELRQSGELWEQRSLLTGSTVTRKALGDLLSQGPRVFHVASHIVPTGAGSPAIALGLNSQARLELWTASEIASLNSAPEYVALSGCGSGTGPVLRAAGLMGLPRAWMVAGSRAVVASFWPTPEESDWLFINYYRRLRDGSDESASRRAAIALRQVQADAIGHGGWRGRPWYWGAYFIIGAL